jgi:hypothetical protein
MLHRQVVALLLLVAASGAPAAPGPRPAPLDAPRLTDQVARPLRGGSGGGPAKAAVDTVFVLGGPDRWDGRFETPGGNPDWHGWTSEDRTLPEVNHWQVSTYQAENLNGHGAGNHAMWCGEDLPSCGPDDPEGGYGDNYNDGLEWSYTAADPGQPTTVTISAWLNTDLVDAGWDFLHLECYDGNGWQTLETWTGTYDNVYVEHQFTVQAGQYGGPGGDRIRLRWRVFSDWGYSDADCLSPSHGACQLDDVTILIDGALAAFDDFEPGSPVNWSPALEGVGDFAHLRQHLGDLDPCRTNVSWQVTFIDDGVVVPGTGGSPCDSWCYGPDGWIVNNTGGLMAGEEQIMFVENAVVSPPLAWPAAHGAGRLDFDVYRHEELGPQSIWPGMFYTWYVRSTAGEDPADLAQAEWRNRNFLHFGGPEYARHEEFIGDLLEPGARWVQVSLEVTEFGWAWGWVGPDGTPAPYFDNVAVRAWTPGGPDIVVDEGDLWQDAFPEQGVIDPADPASNWCRLDAADASEAGGAVVPDDAMRFECASAVAGSELVESPRLHWVLDCNPLFDAVRAAAPGANGLLRGSAPADSARGSTGVAIPGTWTVDLPDTGFFYPGDRLHFYITAHDDRPGGAGASVWPADTTSVLDFGPTSSYSRHGVVRALPALDAAWQQPGLLLWFNRAEDRYLHVWERSLGELGFEPGVDYDLYRSRLGYWSSGHGLGGRCSVDILDGYADLAIAAGDARYAGIGGSNNVNDDTALLLAWLDRGDKGLLAMGDRLVSGSLAEAASVGVLFTRMGVAAMVNDIADDMGGVRDLRVRATLPGGPLPLGVWWQVNAGCPDLARVDGLDAVSGAMDAAMFFAADGTPTSFTGVVSMEEVLTGNRMLTVPLALERVHGDQMGGNPSSPLSSRTVFLQHLLSWLGASGTGQPVAAPDALPLRVSAHPNPFNPRTTLAWSQPRAGRVRLSVYDLRGRLVRSLVDEDRPAGRHEVVWDGRTDAGDAAASGVYFYRLGASAEQRRGKLTLLK